MPIAKLSRTDPTTGETVYYEQPYTPGPDPAQQAWLEEQRQQRERQMMMQARTADAQRAVTAAIQYQAKRNYDRDVANGMDQAEAAAKNANMFFGDPSTMFKAVQPQETYQWNPSTNGAPGYFGGTRGGLRPYVPAGGANQKPTVRSIAGGGLMQINPDGTTKILSDPRPPVSDYETITETIPEVTSEMARPATPEIQARKRAPLGPELDWLFPDVKYQPAKPAIVPHGQQRVTRRVPVNRAPAPLSESVESAPESAPTASNAPTFSGKRIRVKSPEGKVGTISESSLPQALQEGYTQL